MQDKRIRRALLGIIRVTAAAVAVATVTVGATMATANADQPSSGCTYASGSNPANQPAVSSTTPQVNSTYTVSAAVLNPNTTIVFSAVGPNGTSVPIGSPVVIADGVGTTASVQWTPTTAGTHQLYAAESGPGWNFTYGPTTCAVTAASGCTYASGSNPANQPAVSSTTPQVNSTYTVSAAVLNPNTTIVFSAVGPNGTSVPIGSPVVIADGVGTTASVQWTPTTAGTHQLYAAESGPGWNFTYGPTTCAVTAAP
ncbi:hypothetical protein ACIBCN_25375 [Nocardia sp. NPDC051052]|uniref:hypothetical protein n=1 Tax=Nocardia sp. NPDC051052 TaxID=3364322 RepID=UPI003794822E